MEASANRLPCAHGQEIKIEFKVEPLVQEPPDHLLQVAKKPLLIPQMGSKAGYTVWCTYCSVWCAKPWVIKVRAVQVV